MKTVPIFDDVSAQMKEAMRAREAGRLRALRGIRAAFLTELKKDNAETLSDEVCRQILRRLERQRHESIEAFEGGGRTDLADAEREELAVIEEFLPKLADEGTTRDWVRAAIGQTGAARAADVGRVMGALMKAHRGEVDGDLARRIATSLLGG